MTVCWEVYEHAREWYEASPSMYRIEATINDGERLPFVVPQDVAARYLKTPGDLCCILRKMQRKVDREIARRA